MTLRTGDEAPLDRWAQTRHEVATKVVAMTDRMTRMAALKSPLGQGVRNIAVALLGNVPPIRSSVARSLAELDVR
jgi:2-polyprenyl-6-methoxyphenol hydroxylase-like FAD-dependent oxidoreductase